MSLFRKSPPTKPTDYIIVLLTVVLYPLVFLIVYPAAKTATAALAVFPVIVVSWYLGVRWGIVYSLFTIPMDVYLFYYVGDPESGAVIPSTIGSLVFLLVGVGIGSIRNLLEQVRTQTDALLEEQHNLQEEMQRRINAEEQLMHEALHDPLTNLPNRRLFANRLEHAIEWNKRHPQDIFAVIYLDFDRFKLINDSLGHSVGDKFLVILGQRLKSCVRTMDTVARMGGDEFSILLEGVENNDHIIQVVERLLEEFAKPFEIEGNTLIMTASMGVVMNLLDYQQIDDIIRDADIAMYSAKVQGKNNYQIFSPTMREQADKVLQLESDLRRAIENEEFDIYYQPVLSLEDQEITGFEALIRWKHPEKGMLHPADFLKSAEETGMILPIGNWVLVEACKQMNQWQTQFPTDPPLTISVNLSSRQFNQPDLPEQIKHILDETGIIPSSLQLELTEMTLIRDVDAAVEKIERIREMGVEIEIDDFGTGYSSLGYLRHLPVNNLKIDRSFISTLGKNESAIPIIRAIIAMASSLNMKVIAEGIENIDQLNSLKELQCGYGQGFLFEKPLEKQDVETLMQQVSKDQKRS